MELDLQNKVVIVTGASGGIGTAICREFLSEGSIVVAVYRGKEEKIKHLTDWAEINKTKINFCPLPMDITNVDSVNDGIQTVLSKFGKIDVLVNCAGFSLERHFLMTEEEDWQKVMEVNFSSTARMCRTVLKPMFKSKKGAIVNISSVLGSRLGRGVVAYASAKAGINRFTQVLATEVGQKGIRVNAVCPGIIDTRMSSALNTRLGDVLNAMNPLGRNGKPEEVAKAVLFLASEKTASYITGTTLIIDGGISI